MKKWLPWMLTAVFAAWILSALVPKKEKVFHTREFGKLPVLLNGRIQPFDSVARNSLLQLRAKQSIALDGGKTLTAIEWLLEVMMKPEAADARKSFLIDHPELLGLLKLPENEKHFSFNQLKPGFQEIEKQGRRIGAIEPAHRTPFEKQLTKLHAGLTIYNRLKNSLRPESSDDYARELAEYQKAIGPGVVAVRAQSAKQEYDKPAFDLLLGFLEQYNFVKEVALPLVVPPADPEKSRDDWVNAGLSLMDAARNESGIRPAMTRYAAMTSAYRQNKPAEFNAAVEEYRLWLQQKFLPELSKGKWEFFFNDFAPFYKTTVIYVCALVLALVSLLTFSEWLRRSTRNLVMLAWMIHTFGLIFRMVLEGRPPVTNLYSSAIFIGWGAVPLGLILEKVYPIGIGLLTATVAGFTTQIIAHNLAIDGDTMEMMRAVLDTNFWLATHVVVVTLGYAATFVAGLLAIIYVFLGVFTPLLAQKLTRRGAAAISATVGLAVGPGASIADAKKSSPDVGQTEVGKALGKMVYGIICFATLFSFVGTVLGGIWADQSWGRFWGWDPKENGALLIVIWNVAILHARWGGMIKERGLMNMAIFGNIVTAFSWFGVNMLGIGLHSYGFMDSAFKWLMLFAGSQLLVIALGLLPLSLWKSFRGGGGATPTPSGEAKPKPGPPVRSAAGV